MIKPEELRIGNLVSLAGSNVKVDSISEYDTRLTDKCEPIELTPEWLERFGFVLANWENPFPDYKMKYWVRDGVTLFFNEGEHNKGAYLVGVADYKSNFDGTGQYVVITKNWIYHVHILQNFYRAWTGRELELKK